MLYSLLHYSFLGVVLPYLTALTVSLVVGAWLIRFFHRKNVIEDTTQPDHVELNKIQSMKKNVPTMGGLMILAAILISTLLWGDLSERFIWIGLLVLVVLGSAGFVDDYIKLKHKPSRGLTKKQKLIVQFILGSIVGYLLRESMDGRTTMVAFPSRGDYALAWGGIDLGWYYIPWCGFIMAAASNAVNLTDGLDGLAGGLSLIALPALVLVAAEAGSCHDGPRTDAAFGLSCIAAVSVAGFLWYNCHPAQIFMGDTGSLALGGLMAYSALLMRAEIILLVVGAVFFIEELTVAIQIVSFKLTKKRVFPITPIHHYFQVNLKWPEQKIVTRAWLLGLLFALAAYVACSFHEWGLHGE